MERFFVVLYAIKYSNATRSRQFTGKSVFDAMDECERQHPGCDILWASEGLNVDESKEAYWKYVRENLRRTNA